MPDIAILVGQALIEGLDVKLLASKILFAGMRRKPVDLNLPAFLFARSCYKIR